MIAGILDNVVAAPSYVVRSGGDELAVVVENGAPDLMRQLEEQYRAKIVEHNQDCPQLPLSVSMGWAVSDALEDTEILFKTTCIARKCIKAECARIHRQNDDGGAGVKGSYYRRPRRPT